MKVRKQEKALGRRTLPNGTQAGSNTQQVNGKRKDIRKGGINNTLKQWDRHFHALFSFSISTHNWKILHPSRLCRRPVSLIISVKKINPICAQSTTNCHHSCSLWSSQYQQDFKSPSGFIMRWRPFVVEKRGVGVWRKWGRCYEGLTIVLFSQHVLHLWRDGGCCRGAFDACRDKCSRWTSLTGSLRIFADWDV